METWDPRTGNYGSDRDRGTPGGGRPNPGPTDPYSDKTELYGSPLPLVYGTAWVPGRVIYAPIGQPTDFAPEMFDNPAYPSVGWVRCVPAMTWRAQIAFCQGPVAAIEYVKRDKVVFGSYATGSGLFNFNLLSEASGSFGPGPNPQGVTFPYAPTFVLGDAATAAPWSVVAGEPSWLHHFAYGHVAHMRCERLVVGSDGRFPTFSARVRGKLASYVDPHILAEFGKTVYGALPGDIIRDLATSTKWGRGLSGATVVTSVGSDNQAASSFDSYCHSMGWYLGLAITEADTFDSILAKILEATNSVPVWSGGGTSLKIIPLGDSPASRGGYTYSPPSVSLGVTDDDYYRDDGDNETPPIEFESIDEEDTRNVFPIGYVNGNATTEDEIVTSAMETASVSLTGMRKAETSSLPMIRSAAHALGLSAIKAKRSLYCTTVFKFALNRRYPGVESADMLSPSSAAMGISARTVRVLNVEEGPDGSWAIEGVEWPLGVTVTPVYFPADTDGLDYTPDQGGNFALGAVAGMGSDAVFSVSEHALALTSWNDLTQSGTAVASLDLTTKAAAAGVSSTAFTAAITALGTYLNGGTAWTSGTPSWLTGTVDVAVVPATWQSTWAAAYIARAALQNTLTQLANTAIAEMVADGKVTPAEKGALCDALAAIANADANHYSVIKAKLPTGVGTPRQDYEDALAAMSSFLTNFMGGIGLAYYYPTASQAQKDALYAWKQVTTVVMDGSQAGGEAIRFAFAWIYSAQAKVDAAAATSPAVAMTALGAGSVSTVTGTPSSTTYLRGDGTWATPPVSGAPAWADITGKPTFGTASALDVPAAGNAASGQVVKGSDTRLSDSRTASDVSAWAKAASKPSYVWTEIGSRPTLGTASALDVPATGNATTTQVVKGDDSRLSDLRVASSISGYGNPATTATASTIAYRDTSGWLFCVDLSTSSDRRGKRKVRNLRGALARVLGLRGVSFFRKGDKAKAQRIGLIAQEAREVVPEVVNEDADGMLSVSYGSLVALLIEAIREIVARLDRLEGRR